MSNVCFLPSLFLWAAVFVFLCVHVCVCVASLDGYGLFYRLLAKNTVKALQLETYLSLTATTLSYLLLLQLLIPPSFFNWPFLKFLSPSLHFPSCFIPCSSLHTILNPIISPLFHSSCSLLSELFVSFSSEPSHLKESKRHLYVTEAAFDCVIVSR